MLFILLYTWLKIIIPAGIRMFFSRKNLNLVCVGTTTSFGPGRLHKTQYAWLLTVLCRGKITDGGLWWSTVCNNETVCNNVLQSVARMAMEIIKTLLFLEAGGFYSAEDADSLPTAESTSKKEGAFCVLTHKQIQEILKEKVKDTLTLAEVFCHYFNIQDCWSHKGMMMLIWNPNFLYVSTYIYI